MHQNESLTPLPKKPKYHFILINRFFCHFLNHKKRVISHSQIINWQGRQEFQPLQNQVISLFFNYTKYTTYTILLQAIFIEFNYIYYTTYTIYLYVFLLIIYINQSYLLLSSLLKLSSIHSICLYIDSLIC